MSYSAESTAPQQALDVGRCVNDAIDIYKQNWMVLALAALLFEVLILCSLTVLAGPLCGGVCLMLLRTFERDDETVDLGDMFRCFNQFLSLAGLFYLTFFAILIGCLLCFVPGLLLATFWLFPFYLVVDRKLGIFAALQTSKEIVVRKGFWLNLAVFAISVALQLAPSGIPYLGVVIGWCLTPLGWLIVTSAYIQQVREDLGELDDVLNPSPVVL